MLSIFFFFKLKTAYDMLISDWSSDVCSSDLSAPGLRRRCGAWKERRGSCRLACCRSVAHETAQLLEHGERFLADRAVLIDADPQRSEEHTSELQSLMRISYAVFCLKKKKKLTNHNRI